LRLNAILSTAAYLLT